MEFDSFDQYLSADFIVHRDGDTATAKVKDNNGKPIGRRYQVHCLTLTNTNVNLKTGL